MKDDARAEPIDWIAVDWGTTHLRAWAMSADGAVLDEAQSSAGMATLEADGFEPALLALIAPWLCDPAPPVVACGMVGSRQGWTEAPYAAVPSPPISPVLVMAPVRDTRLSVAITPGLKQTDPADVMRGEETQIAGLLAAEPEFDGVVCLPGTHSKWAHVSAGEVVSFRSLMTGEMFEAIAAHTVLRHSVGDGWDDAAFDDAVSDARAKPEMLAARLFSLRADHLLRGPAPGAARARLSGLLIGAELAATRPYWLGRRVALIGAPGLSGHYARALEAQGVCAEIMDGARMTRRGLAVARALLGKGVLA